MMASALLLAAAVVVAPAAPRVRVMGQRSSAKTPRDGPGGADPLDLADDVELFALCLSAGLPVEAAATAVADAAGESTSAAWRRAASLLAVGVSVDRAFVDAEAVAGFADLVRLLSRSAHSGAAMAASCRDLAGSLRAQAHDAAVARAERAGVLIAVPLTGCFLPAFVVLGLVPVIVSLGSDLLSTTINLP